MKSKIEVTMSQVEKGKLFIKAQGFLEGNSSGRARLSAIFSNGGQDRRFPLEADGFFSEEEGGSFFVGKGEISLSDVFYLRPWEKLSESQTAVAVEAVGFRGLGGGGHRVERVLLEDTGIWISKELFLKKEEKRSLWFFLYRIIAAMLCILLLPVFLLDALFALKGFKPLDTGENPARGFRGALLHANELTKRLCGFSYSLREAKTQYLRLCYSRYCKAPVNPREALFLSERLLEENSNLARVKEELAARGAWGGSREERDSAREALSITEFIHREPIHKLKFRDIRQCAKKMAKARCIVLEDFYPQLHGLTVREETKVVQLWHACGAFKTFGFSRLGKPGGPREDSKNHRNYDYAIVSGSQMAPIYSEAFGIPLKNVKPLGAPRTDIFFQDGYGEEVRKKLFQKYPALSGKKVILFAPTFRGDGNKTAYYPTKKADWNYFFQRVSEDYVVILKNHPFVKDAYSYDKEWEGRIVDLTGKDNINDLLFVADLLITDYSSSVFEAALLEVPMVFYVFDKKEYLEGRDSYYDFDSFAPGRQAKDMEELVRAVEEALSGQPDGDLAKRQEEREKYAWFREEFLDALAGGSTEAIADLIQGLMAERGGRWAKR